MFPCLISSNQQQQQQQQQQHNRGSAGRLLVKLCIEVCVCFYRSPDPSKSVLIQHCCSMITHWLLQPEPCRQPCMWSAAAAAAATMASWGLALMVLVIWLSGNRLLRFCGKLMRLCHISQDTAVHNTGYMQAMSVVMHQVCRVLRCRYKCS
jgi:hypothetical protein